MIDDVGIHPAPEKVWTIMDWTSPESQKELQRFNGMVNYISQFIPQIATITAPLTELCVNAEWLWTDRQEAAFEWSSELQISTKSLDRSTIISQI